jgi:hypothetical protein
MKQIIQKTCTIKTLCAIFFGLFLATSCVEPEEPIKPKPPIDNPTNYPIDIPFTEYSLEETQCQWTNLSYNDKVIIINSKEELEKYIECVSGSYPAIDFSKNSLLLVSSKTYCGTSIIAVKKLQQLSSNEYKLDIEITLNDDIAVESWNKALIIEKLSKESDVELNVMFSEGDVGYFHVAGFHTLNNTYYFPAMYPNKYLLVSENLLDTLATCNLPDNFFDLEPRIGDHMACGFLMYPPEEQLTYKFRMRYRLMTFEEKLQFRVGYCSVGHYANEHIRPTFIVIISISKIEGL